MAQLSEHFSTQEFRCKHCGLLVKIDDELLAKLEQLRELAGGHPIKVTSGYRCPEHNFDVGGARDSYHVKGMAADVKIEGLSPLDVADLAGKVGFGGIGIYPSWTHVDTREEKAQWIKDK